MLTPRCGIFPGTLERKFGEWESTGELIDRAVTTLSKELQEVRLKLDEQAEKLGIVKKVREKKDRSYTNNSYSPSPTRSLTKGRKKPTRVGGGGLLAAAGAVAFAPLNVVVAAGSSVVEAGARAVGRESTIHNHARAPAAAPASSPTLQA